MYLGCSVGESSILRIGNVALEVGKGMQIILAHNDGHNICSMIYQ